ncbi:major facilitator superfamily domain-containing protein [Biscogniauxia mediterranea]|nr:major facilitator superfamily domain-containing protein [Biscogniauxia mediterranea]
MLSTLWNKAFGKDGTSQSKKQKTCPHSANETIQDGSQGGSHGRFVVDESNARQEACSQCKAEKGAMRKYRRKLVPGLLLPYALQALDVTMTGRLSQLNWAVAAFNLTAAAFIPLPGPDSRYIRTDGTGALQSRCFLTLMRPPRGLRRFSARPRGAEHHPSASPSSPTRRVPSRRTAKKLDRLFFTLVVAGRPVSYGVGGLQGLDADGARRRDRFARRLAALDAGGRPARVSGWVSASSFSPSLGPGRAMRGPRLRCWPPWSSKPMLPWRLVKDRNIGILLYTNLATGMAMYSHYPPNEAGIQLLLYTPGLGGSIVEAVGVGLMAWALYLEHTPTIFGVIALTGVGTGLRFMPCTLHAIGFFPRDISSVVAIMGVAYTFGGTMGLTVMTTVFNNVTPDNLKNGIVWAFFSLTPFMVICILGSACLGNVNITKGADGSSSGEVSGSNLICGSYVLALLRGEKKPRKEPVDEESRIAIFSFAT